MATHRLIDRETARLSELTHFFTGEPCDHGHVGLRYTSNGICVQCHTISRREYQDRRRAERDIAIAQRQTAKAEQARARELRLAEEAAAKVERERLALERRKVELERRKVELELRKVERSNLLKSHEEKIDKRASRRRRQADYARHLPAPHERDCPPRPTDCQCCGRYIGAEKLRLDHDHREPDPALPYIAGRFRGWTCDRCNRGIGALGDLPGGLKAALEYLEAHYRDKPEPWDTDFKSGSTHTM
jgi:Recombination endonuclease VII